MSELIGIYGSNFITQDLLLEIAKGNIPGHSQINKFGANDNATADTENDISDVGGTYSYPSTADITHISQTTDQVALRGATIEIQGLDIDWNLVVQEVNLNATNTTTAVVLETPLLRIFRKKVLSLTKCNAVISTHNSGNTTTYSSIAINKNQTRMALFTIPANYSGYVIDYYADYTKTATKDPTSVEFEIWIQNILSGYTFQVKGQRGIPQNGPGFIQPYRPYMKVTEKSDIKLTAYPEDQNAKVHGGFNIILVKN